MRRALPPPVSEAPALPPAAGEEPVAPMPRPRPAPSERPVTAPAPAPQTPALPASADGCLAALSAAGVTARAIGEIAEGACGAPAPVKVSAIGGIRLTPAATLRCEMALAAADWVSRGLVPAARKHLSGQPSEIFVAASYHCRTRRTGRGPSRRLSEHAKANALDVRGVRMADGREVGIAPKGSGRSRQVEAFQAAIRAAGCESFKTVIGPLTDPAHHDHLHFDLAQRKRGGVVCR